MSRLRVGVLEAATSAERKTGNAGPGEFSVRATGVLAARVAGALTVAAGAIAAIASVTVASGARHWFAYPFAGIPARPGEAVAIFLHNLRALSAVGGLLLVSQSPRWGGKMTGGSVPAAIRRGGEALIAAVVSANVIVVGTSLGAYGLRMACALLPHGPIELAAYALALALYLQGRDKSLSLQHVLAVFALSISLLALAAVLESFVNL
jgi:hypothetical protein